MRPTQPTGHQIADEHRAAADRALEILLDPALEPIVDMVLTRRDDRYEALAADGPGHLRAHRRRRLRARSAHAGRNPLADQSTDKFVGLENERANLLPAPRRQRLPVRLRADRAALRLARRARPVRDPLGRAQLGRPGRPPRRARLDRDRAGPRADGDRRQGREVARRDPAGRPPRRHRAHHRRAARLRAPRRRQATSRSKTASRSLDVLDPSERPSHVVAFLFDGTNSNVLYDMCARGEAPNVARLIEMGVAFGHGAMSSLPTVTLANHTSIITGAHPGHHGILNNAWFDRATGEQVITNSQATWPW